MPRAAFTQQQVKRAVAGARAAGIAPNAVTIHADGSITVEERPAQEVAASPLDDWLNRNENRP